ncbi:hypothetical protein [Mycobacteroides abscessus]|uniref:hypothetical protein n=1 Tax=Desemzia sp. FAM 23989 TaxID=3259523 RepID=UPI00104F4F1E
MKKAKLLAALGICGLILGACGAEDDSKYDTSTTEVSESEAVVKEPGLDELDPAVSEELSKMGTDEEIDWEKINFNKRQYKEYIESLDEQETDSSETGESTLTVVSSSMVDDNTIEIVINNTDASEMSELTNGFFAIMMDTFSRQLYLNSDYSDGTNQPTIIIKDNAGTVISEETDFIEMEETE